MKHEFLGRQDIPVEAVMPAVAQQYAFDLLTVVQLKQQLFGSVGGAMVLGDGRRPKRELRRQLPSCELDYRNQFLAMYS